MDDQTRNLSLPYIMPSQAQKHITHNEALRVLDALVQISFRSIGTNAPPTTPVEGDQYAIGGNPTDVWQNQANKIAVYQDSAWAFFEAQKGWIAFEENDNKIVVFDGEEWVSPTSNLDALQNLTFCGVNATADDENRLAVASNGSLFNHIGAGHQVKVNKNTEQDTGSILFQTGFSGRAEFGLTGDDNWRVKVTPDNNTWYEAIQTDRYSGEVSFPNGIRHLASGQTPEAFISIPRATGSIFRIDKLHSQNPRTAIIEAISNDVITLASDNADLFMSYHMAGEAFSRIWNISQSADQHSAWVKLGQQIAGITTPNNTSFSQTRNDQLTVTDASHLHGWSIGDTIQIGDPASITPNRCATYDISPMMQNRFGRVFQQTGLMVKYFISGDTNILTPLQTTGIGITADGVSGSFNNATSNNQGVPSQGLLYVGCHQLSPISNSNLISIRETGPTNAIKISLISIVGLLVGR